MEPSTAEPVFDDDQIFISYARRNSDGVRPIVDELAAFPDWQVWMDASDIPPSSSWWQEIEDAIIGSTCFIAFLSPEYLASTNCMEEAAFAIASGKQIVTVSIAEVAFDDFKRSSAPELAAIHWINNTRDLEPRDIAMEINVAMQSDLAWSKFHTQLLDQTTRWINAGRPSTSLLRGQDIQNAEYELAIDRPTGQPTPTGPQREFVLASRSRRTRVLRVSLSGALLALLVVCGLGIAFVRATVRADQEERAATGSRVASLASEHLQGDTSLSLLLGAFALTQNDGQVERAALIKAITESRVTSTIWDESVAGRDLFVIGGALFLVGADDIQRRDINTFELVDLVRFSEPGTTMRTLRIPKSDDAIVRTVWDDERLWVDVVLVETGDVVARQESKFSRQANIFAFSGGLYLVDSDPYKGRTFEAIEWGTPQLDQSAVESILSASDDITVAGFEDRVASGKGYDENQQVIVASNDAATSIKPLSTGRRVAAERSLLVSGMAWDNSGRTLAVAMSDRTITLVDTERGLVFGTGLPLNKTSDVVDLEFSTNDKFLVALFSDGSMHLFGTRDALARDQALTPLQTYPPFNDWRSTGFVFLPGDHDVLVVTNRGLILRSLDPGPGGLAQLLELRDTRRSGQDLFVIDGSSTYVRVLNEKEAEVVGITSGEVESNVSLLEGLSHVQAHDGGLVFSGSDDKGVWLSGEPVGGLIGPVEELAGSLIDVDVDEGLVIADNSDDLSYEELYRLGNPGFRLYNFNDLETTVSTFYGFLPSWDKSRGFSSSGAWAMGISEGDFGSDLYILRTSARGKLQISGTNDVEESPEVQVVPSVNAAVISDELGLLFFATDKGVFKGDLAEGMISSGEELMTDYTVHHLDLSEEEAVLRGVSGSTILQWSAIDGSLQYGLPLGWGDVRCWDCELVGTEQPFVFLGRASVPGDYLAPSFEHDDVVSGELLFRVDLSSENLIRVACQIAGSDLAVDQRLQYGIPENLELCSSPKRASKPTTVVEVTAEPLAWEQKESDCGRHSRDMVTLSYTVRDFDNRCEVFDAVSSLMRGLDGTLGGFEMPDGDSGAFILDSESAPYIQIVGITTANDQAVATLMFPSKSWSTNPLDECAQHRYFVTVKTVRGTSRAVEVEKAASEGCG